MHSHTQKLRSGEIVIRTIFTEDDLKARIDLVEKILSRLTKLETSTHKGELSEFIEYLTPISKAMKGSCIRDQRYNEGRPTMTWFPNLSQAAILFFLQSMAFFSYAVNTLYEDNCR